MQIEFEVENQRLTLASESYIVAAQERFIEAHFTFVSDDWDGLTKYAVFEREELRTAVEVDADEETVTVPTGCTISDGEFRLSLVGVSNSGDWTTAISAGVYTSGSATDATVSQDAITKALSIAGTGENIVATTNTLTLRVRDNELYTAGETVLSGDKILALAEIDELASLSQRWAESSDSPDREKDADSPTGYTQSSKTWALSVKGSSEAAAASAAAAATSESNAATYRTNAADSATSAAASEATAKEYRDSINPDNFLKLTGGTVTGDLTVEGATTLNSLTCSGAATVTGNITSSGTITANKVVNAYYNDYAEYFERGGETETGDIIALDETADGEKYVKATESSRLVVGVQSAEFAQIIGGVTDAEGNFDFEENLKDFIPVALAGRVSVRFYGKAEAGARVVPGAIPGAGRMFADGDDPEKVVGRIVKADEYETVRLVRIVVGR